MPSLREMLATKPAPAAASGGGAGPAGGGLVIRPAAPPPPPPPAPPPERLLGDAHPDPRPDVPFEFASEKSSEAAKAWLAARQCPATKLGLWLEPEGEHAWLALDLPEDPGRLVLLYRLPLLSRRNGTNPF